MHGEREEKKRVQFAPRPPLVFAASVDMANYPRAR
jgi:hypothetical protein